MKIVTPKLSHKNCHIHGALTMNNWCQLASTVLTLQVNALYIVPPVATFLAKHPLVEKYNFRSLDSVLSGAAPLGKELTELMKNRFPTLPVLGQGIYLIIHFNCTNHHARKVYFG